MCVHTYVFVHTCTRTVHILRPVFTGTRMEPGGQEKTDDVRGDPGLTPQDLRFPQGDASRGQTGSGWVPSQSEPERRQGPERPPARPRPWGPLSFPLQSHQSRRVGPPSPDRTSDDSGCPDSPLRLGHTVVRPVPVGGPQFTLFDGPQNTSGHPHTPVHTYSHVRGTSIQSRVHYTTHT